MDRPAVCVLCRTHPVDPRWRPFCSRQCQVADLGRWASEAYRVPGPPDPDLAEAEPEPDDLDEA